MFANCRNITNIPNFYTNNVTNMRYMFQNCWNLTSVPNFDTSSVTEMYGMFENCMRLTLVPDFDTKNITSMRGMFDYCSSLTTIPNFDTSNVTDMSQMFANCHNLTTIPNFDTNKVTNMYRMFYWCRNIRGDLYIESNNVTVAVELFANSAGTILNSYTKNIYCHANTNTYNTIYRAMGSNTYNSNWNAHLYTMEDNYAYINTYNNTFMGSGYILRFPTNKVEVCTNTGTLDCVLEVIPYTNYFIEDYIVTPVTPDGDMIPRCMYQFSYTNSNGINIRTERNVILPVCPSFRFFNGIENSTANYSLL